MPAGEWLIREGETAEHLFLLKAGQCELLSERFEGQGLDEDGRPRNKANVLPQHPNEMQPEWELLDWEEEVRRASEEAAFVGIGSPTGSNLARVASDGLSGRGSGIHGVSSDQSQIGVNRIPNEGRIVGNTRNDAISVYKSKPSVVASEHDKVPAALVSSRGGRGAGEVEGVAQRRLRRGPAALEHSPRGPQADDAVGEIGWSDEATMPESPDHRMGRGIAQVGGGIGQASDWRKQDFTDDADLALFAGVGAPMEGPQASGPRLPAKKEGKSWWSPWSHGTGVWSSMIGYVLTYRRRFELVLARAVAVGGGERGGRVCVRGDSSA